MDHGRGGAGKHGPGGGPLAGVVPRDPHEGMIPFRSALERHPDEAERLRGWMARRTGDDDGPDSTLWCGLCQQAFPAGGVWVAPAKPGHFAYAKGRRLYTVCPSAMNHSALPAHPTGHRAVAAVPEPLRRRRLTPVRTRNGKYRIILDKSLTPCQNPLTAVLGG